MTRTADEKRPGELLDAIVKYLVRYGVAELSLRPLARAVGSSPRVLLYYFGSKEDLVLAAVMRLRERQRAGFGQMREARYEDPSDACRAIWKQMSAPEAEMMFRLSLETYSLALRYRRRFRGYLESSIEDWLRFLVEPMRSRGVPEAAARAFATVVVAGFRGFMLDYCATRDRERVDRAVDLWLDGLDRIAPKPAHGHPHQN